MGIIWIWLATVTAIASLRIAWLTEVSYLTELTAGIFSNAGVSAPCSALHRQRGLQCGKGGSVARMSLPEYHPVNDGYRI